MSNSNNRPEPDNEQLSLLLSLWRFSLATPVIYMTISLFIGRTYYTEERNGFWEQPPDNYYLILGAVALLIMIFSVVLFWLRARRNDCSPVRYRRYTHIMLALCDFTAMIGLILYLIQADANAQGVLCLIAWIGYAFSKPIDNANEGE